MIFFELSFCIYLGCFFTNKNVFFLYYIPISICPKFPFFYIHFYTKILGVFSVFFSTIFGPKLESIFSHFLFIFFSIFYPLFSLVFTKNLSELPQVRITCQCVRITVQCVRITDHYRTVIRTWHRPRDGNETVPYIKQFKTIKNLLKL